MKFLLDTNICIYLIKKNPTKIVEKLTSFPAYDIGISSITLAELEYGVEKSEYPEKNRQALFGFLSPFSVIAFDDKAALVYGKVRCSLEKMGQLIGAMDMLIAAHALNLDLTLVTNNLKEFKRVKGLKVINWA